MMKNKICDCCGKPYEYQFSVTYTNGEKFCKHDENFNFNNGRPIDIATSSMKQDRKQYAKDTLQPYKNGKANPDFQKVYGKNNQAYNN